MYNIGENKPTYTEFMKLMKGDKEFVNSINPKFYLDGKTIRISTPNGEILSDLSFSRVCARNAAHIVDDLNYFDIYYCNGELSNSYAELVGSTNKMQITALISEYIPAIETMVMNESNKAGSDSNKLIQVGFAMKLFVSMYGLYDDTSRDEYINIGIALLRNELPSGYDLLHGMISEIWASKKGMIRYAPSSAKSINIQNIENLVITQATMKLTLDGNARHFIYASAKSTIEYMLMSAYR